MSDQPINQSNATSRFYTNHLKYLAKSSIPEKKRRGYIKHIKTFIKAQNGNKIKTLSAADITWYFEAPGCQNRLKGWQFLQQIHAIQILYFKFLALAVYLKVRHPPLENPCDEPCYPISLTNEEKSDRSNLTKCGKLLC